MAYSTSGQARPPADCHAPLLSLPRLFGTDWASIPASIPYLSADAGRREHWRQQLAGSGGLRVGLVWQGNPNFGGDRQRSARLAQMAPLSRVPGVRLYSLQKGPSVEQLQAEAGQAVTDLGADGWPDFAETAAVVVNLDLVIAVDTAVAHLAGALGVPVWLALPQASDWRWLVGREDSPWYPSMRLFRQRRRGDWNEVFLRMARALEQRVQKNAPRSNPPPAVAPADPSRADYRQGLELLRQGKLAESVALLRRAVAFRPAEGEWQHGLGVALARSGKLLEAIGCFREALRLDPAGAEVHNNLGLALLHAGHASDAVDSFREALRRKPQWPEVCNNLGVALLRLTRYAEAIEEYRKALELKPDYAEAHNNLGNALRLQGKLDEAVMPLRESLRLRPDFVEPLYNLGITLMQLGRAEEALEWLERTIKVAPAHEEARSNLAVLLNNLGRVDEAIACYDEILRHQPDSAPAHKGRALARLRQGDFARGWAEYEWRWRIPGTVPVPEPSWDGSPLDGRTILLHAEQGLADTLQFVRYAALVKERGGRVFLECPAPLTRLLGTCPGIESVVACGAARPPADCHAPLLSLPRLFGTDLDSVPASVPYLSAETDRREHWRQQLATGRKVGLVWQSNLSYGGTGSARLAQMSPITRVAGVRLYSLQKGAGAEQLQEEAGKAVTHLGAESWADFAETAAVVVNLDLVIAVDTAVAHLAGALGVPVWLALPEAADWRWLVEREDTPWYPSMRLFRQRRRGDWDEVFQRMADALGEKLARAEQEDVPLWELPKSQPLLCNGPTKRQKKP